VIQIDRKPALSFCDPRKPPDRGAGIESDRLREFQELKDAHPMLPSLDGRHERLAAPDLFRQFRLAHFGFLARSLIMRRNTSCLGEPISFISLPPCDE
jgi:hypothetical protein